MNATAESCKLERFATRRIAISFHRSAMVLLVVMSLLAIGCAGTTSAGGNSPNGASQNGLSVQLGPHSVTLNWGASESTVVGYNVYRTTQSGTGYALLTSTPVAATSYTDTSVSDGETYFYVVTAVNTYMLESGYSNEVSATVP